MRLGGWRFSPHAVLRAQELGFSLRDLVECLAAPEVSYGTEDGRPGRVFQRGDVSVVALPEIRYVITALLRRTEVWRHGVDRR